MDLMDWPRLRNTILYACMFWPLIVCMAVMMWKPRWFPLQFLVMILLMMVWDREVRRRQLDRRLMRWFGWDPMRRAW